MARFEDLTVGKLTILNDLVSPFGKNPHGGQDYYVDGNKVTDGPDGKTFKTASHALASAITLSDASIGLSANRWWARRNRIFVCGDVLTEGLVKFPTKCDVIGVGSYDANTKPGIYGQHTPVGESYGTRFFNIHFKSTAVAAPVFTLTSATSGLQLHGCTIDGTLGTMTIGIQATASPFLVVDDCDFVGTFVTSYITFGAGEVGWTQIKNNRMLGTAAKGIVSASATSSWIPLISGNLIKATGLTIDDDDDIFSVIDNRLITAADIATTTAGYDFNLALAAGNILTGLNGVAATVPFAVIAE